MLAGAPRVRVEFRLVSAPAQTTSVPRRVSPRARHGLLRLNLRGRGRRGSERVFARVRPRVRRRLDARRRRRQPSRRGRRRVGRRRPRRLRRVGPRPPPRARPSLRRTRGKRLGDDYDESDAELIGKGAFSVVYLVRHRRTGGSFAAKIISTEGVTPERRREHIRVALFTTAFGVAAAAAHDTIVAFRDLFFEPDRAILVQEYCHGGTLLRTVQRKVDARAVRGVASPALAPSAKSAASAAPPLGGVGADPGGADPYPTTPEEENAEAAAAAAVMAASGGALRERDVVVAVRRVAEARAHLHAVAARPPRRQTRKSSPRRPG